MKEKTGTKAEVEIIIPRYSDDELNEFGEMILSKIADQQALLEYEEDPPVREHIAKFIINLEAAYRRTKDKSYGRCLITKKLINKQRLISCLCATTSVEAKPIQKAAEAQLAVDKRAQIALMTRAGRQQVNPV